MEAFEEHAGLSRPEAERFRWIWVSAGVLTGAALVILFLYIVDPGLQRPDVAGFVVALSVILVGILVGYFSRGETIHEAGLAGLILFFIAAGVSHGPLGIALPGMVWVVAPFVMATLALFGGWVGEMLQGTMEEAYEDEAVDWPWVFVSVFIGVTLSAYAVFLGEALFGLTTGQSLYVFAGSFLVTGWIVGFFSPGVTMVEPAIAAFTMLVADSSFVILWFDGLPGFQILAGGFAAGVVLALVGGWLGELTQKLRRARPAPRI